MAAKNKKKVWYEAGLFQKDGTVKVEKVAEPRSGRRKVIGSLKRLIAIWKRDPNAVTLTDHAKNMMNTFSITL